MRAKIVLGFLLMALFVQVVVSCAPTPTPQDSVGWRNMDNGVWRYVDKEAGVVCWGRYSYGISCLPLSQTKLGQ
jgi:hypothetical protein